MKAKKNKDTMTKIEVDEKTNEPIFVQVPLDDIKTDVEKELDETKIEKADFVERKADKSIGKQLVIKRVLGLNSPEEKAVSKRQKLFKNLFTLAFFIFVVGVLAFTFYNDFFATDR